MLISKNAILFSLGVLIFHGHAVTGSPPVEVGLRSSWPAPPLLVEIMESIALEIPLAFFPFVGAFVESDIFSSLNNLSPDKLYNRTLEHAISAGFLSDPASLAAVELNLALHTATPKIEAFYQHYAENVRSDSMTEREDCRSWVDWYGTTVCDVDTLARLAGANPDVFHPSGARPKVLAFDHIHPSAAERPPRTAILYASFPSANLRGLHNYLMSLSHDPVVPVEYIFRHVPPPVQKDPKRNYLSGYGISMDMKKMEYLALDDRHSGHRGPVVETTSNGGAVIEDDPILPLLRTYPENETGSGASSPLSESELLGIGLQSTQLIMDSSEPLDSLIHLSQNFPKYMTTIARRVVVNENLTAEVYENHVKAQPGVNMMWINGAHIVEKDVDPFSLTKLLRKERNMMNSLTSLGLSREEAIELLTHPSIASAQQGKNILDGIFDASDRPEEGGVIVWWNDIQNDKRYSRWSPSIHALLQPLYPGQLPSIRLNLFNVILVLDLSQTSSLNFITGAVANIIDRNFPVRFGLVPIADNEEGTRMARLVYYMIQTYGRAKTMTFLKSISQPLQSMFPHSSTVDWSAVQSQFDDFLAFESLNGNGALTNLESLVGTEGNLVVDLNKTRGYTERLGVTPSHSPTGHAFVNGKYFEMDDGFLRNMQLEMGQQLHHLQGKVHEGQITQDHVDAMSTYFYDQPTTHSRRNRYIHSMGSSGSLRIHNLFDLFTRASFPASATDFVYPPQAENVPLSVFIVADVGSISGLDLVRETLGSLDESSRMRVAFIHNPIDPSRDREWVDPSELISDLISHGPLSKFTPAQILHVLDFNKLWSPDGQPTWRTAWKEITDGAVFDNADNFAYARYVESCRRVVRDLRINPGDRALIVNGRLVGPFREDDNFVSADIRVLEAYELQKRVEPIMQALSDALSGQSRDMAANLVSMSSSIVWSAQLSEPNESGLFDSPPKPRQRNYRLLTSDYTSFELGDASTAMYQVAVLLDPLSEAAQKWSSLVKWLARLPFVFVEVYLNPQMLSEVPLKRFYRYNLQSSLSFDNDGQELSSYTVFRDLPIEPLYTLAMDVPPSWLVRPRQALYDLDNIQLGNLSPEDPSVEAIFDLDYLVIEGHARDAATQGPPRGVQLQLTNSNSTSIDDTLVAANLGYLQFKAKPGVFRLEIRPGRGREIFEMESVGNEGWESPSVDAVGNEITLTSFEGLTLYPRLRRRPGMENANVLVEPSEEKVSQPESPMESIMSKIKSLFGIQERVGTDVLPRTADQADINIFTVASGLLYERFASIMILSVLRNTNSSVKFWFIENFLSPSFLEFIPHMADTYGFKYELVTYKWPSWLRAQKEKQRIIWAYKILFLDVLFPMDLKKVIFVDADQIVRVDLKELVDLDLHGAPYGYTPMGDDNEEMEGFRFWKTGYWKEFLQGRPYHISALYVVDLVRFRQIAAGDILRGHYQALSQDPNSLSNLDQDLPNNLQREVPIFSLHQDWLWCETWCSKSRLHLAKTIDLCQNPLTKEPKLSRARKIPEWEEYDGEIARFAQKLAEEGLIRSSMAAADANVLASDGTPAKPGPQHEPQDSSADGPMDKSEVLPDGKEVIRDEL